MIAPGSSTSEEATLTSTTTSPSLEEDTREDSIRSFGDDGEASRNISNNKGGMDNKLVPTFSGLCIHPTSYVTTSQCTVSDIVTTTVTARPLKEVQMRSFRKSNIITLPSLKGRSNNNNQSAIKISTKRLNKKLIKERNKFMKNLEKQRKDREELEQWGATKIQAAFRGYNARPKPLTRIYKRKKRNVYRVEGEEFEGENAFLNSISNNDSPSRRTSLIPEWRRNVVSRAKSRATTKETRLAADNSATVIQSIIRGYLARVGHHYRMIRRSKERYVEKVVKIQACFRGFDVRLSVAERELKARHDAAIKLQATFRGNVARERAGMMKLDQLYYCHESQAATKVQGVYRMRKARENVAFIREQKN